MRLIFYHNTENTHITFYRENGQVECMEITESVIQRPRSHEFLNNMTNTLKLGLAANEKQTDTDSRNAESTARPT